MLFGQDPQPITKSGDGSSGTPHEAPAATERQIGASLSASKSPGALGFRFSRALRRPPGSDVSAGLLRMGRVMRELPRTLPVDSHRRRAQRRHFKLPLASGAIWSICRVTVTASEQTCRLYLFSALTDHGNVGID
jgi:hypothetical protein